MNQFNASSLQYYKNNQPIFPHHIVIQFEQYNRRAVLALVEKFQEWCQTNLEITDWCYTDFTRVGCSFSFRDAKTAMNFKFFCSSMIG